MYAPSEEKVLRGKYVLANDIDLKQLCLIEEDHCLRSQAFNLCELKNKERRYINLILQREVLEL